MLFIYRLSTFYSKVAVAKFYYCSGATTRLPYINMRLYEFGVQSPVCLFQNKPMCCTTTMHYSSDRSGTQCNQQKEVICDLAVQSCLSPTRKIFTSSCLYNFSNRCSQFECIRLHGWRHKIFGKPCFGLSRAFLQRILGKCVQASTSCT